MSRTRTPAFLAASLPFLRLPAEHGIEAVVLLAVPADERHSDGSAGLLAIRQSVWVVAWAPLGMRRVVFLAHLLSTLVVSRLMLSSAIFLTSSQPEISSS